MKTFALNYSISDENIYFYLGKLMAEGKMPYRDFFLAHPPIGILINWVIFSLFGFNFVLLKSVAVFAVALSSYFLFKTVLRAYGGRCAVLSAVLYLFCLNVLHSSSHPMGADLTVFFMLASFFYFMGKRYMLSGALLGLGCATGLYAVVLLACFLVFQIWRRHVLKESMLPLVAGFFGVSIVFNGFFYLLAGQAYVEQVYLYQLYKPVLQEHNFSVLVALVRDNLLIILPLLGLPSLLSREKNDDMAAVLAVAVLGYVIFLASMKTVFEFYFMLAAPFFAALSARILTGYLESSGRWSKNLLAAGFVLFTMWTFLLYYVHEANYFMTAPDMAGYVDSRLSSNQTVFGDSTTTPLIALLSGRRIALDEADTNVQRYLSQTSDINSLIGRLKEEHGGFLFLVSPYQQGVGRIPEAQRYLSLACRPDKGFDEPYVGRYVFYYCGA